MSITIAQRIVEVTFDCVIEMTIRIKDLWKDCEHHSPIVQRVLQVIGTSSKVSNCKSEWCLKCSLSGVWCRPQWRAWLCWVCEGARKKYFFIFKEIVVIIANAKGLAMFTMKNVERERKLRFLFDIYDIDGDGLICNSELYKVRWWRWWW